MRPRVETGVLGEAHVAAHVALASTTYGEAAPTDAAHFRWKHLAGPWGASYSCVLVAENGDSVHGRALIQPRTFVASPGTRYPGGTVVDVLLAPEAREARAFVSLMTTARRHPDLDVVMHTSNETSDPLYQRLLRYPVAFGLTAFGMIAGRALLGSSGERPHRVVGGLVSAAGVCVGWSARVVAPVMRALTGLAVSDASPPPAAIDQALQRFEESAGPHFERHRPFIAWRFSEAPNPARVFWVSLRDGALGYVAVASARVGSISAMVVQDAVIPRPPRRLEGAALRLTVLAMASRSGASVVLGLWNPAHRLSRWFTGLPFVRIPDRVLPHGTPIFFSAPDDDVRHDLDASAYVTLADLDYF